jgi:Bacterial regulatory protein, Fis family
MRPAPNNPQLSALWYTDKPRAVEMCQEALVACNGHREQAATKLQIGRRTFYKWLKLHPEILSGVDGLRFLPASKNLTAAQLRRIRTSKKPGAELAREMGVSEAAISRVRGGSRRAP